MIPDSNVGRCVKDDRQIRNDENLNDLPVSFNIFGYTQTEVKRGLNVSEMFIPEERERELQ